MTTTARDLVEAGACAACLEYGDDYDAQPTDITALRASNLKSFGSEDIKANDPGLPTREDWQAIAVATLIATFRKLAEDGPTEAMYAALAGRKTDRYDGPSREDLRIIFCEMCRALLREMEDLTP